MIFHKYSGREVDHLFICRGWHFYNDMYPFFQALDRSAKYYFSDTGRGDTLSMSDFQRFTSPNKKAILYFSSICLDPIVAKLATLYDQVKFVRLFHGIVGPWAKFIQSPCKLIDVVVAASRLDADFLRAHSDYRVEVVGWPKGENFYRRQGIAAATPSSVLVASNWTEVRGDLRICDHIGDWQGLDRTFMMHPNLSNFSNSARAVKKEYWHAQLEKMSKAGVRVVPCPNGVLEHMRGQAILLGVISSSSLEWLLFDRPIIFLKKSAYLSFGSLLDYDRDIKKQILRALDGPDRFASRRTAYREKLMSHFDGKYRLRFNNLISSLEKQLLYGRIIYSIPKPAAYQLVRTAS